MLPKTQYRQAPARRQRRKLRLRRLCDDDTPVHAICFRSMVRALSMLLAAVALGAVAPLRFSRRAALCSIGSCPAAAALAAEAPNYNRRARGMMNEKALIPGDYYYGSNRGRALSMGMRHSVITSLTFCRVKL